MIKNVTALREALEWATREWLADPDRDFEAGGSWDQTVWFDDGGGDALDDGHAAIDALNECGTSCCLAGRLAIAGMQVTWSEDYLDWTANGRLINWSEDASEVLGSDDDIESLVDRHRRWLFGGDNSVFDLWRIAEDLTDGAITLPTELVDHHIDQVWDRVQYEAAQYRFRIPGATVSS